jgi:hypothetical protein
MADSAPPRQLPMHRSRVQATRSLVLALTALALCTLTAIPHGVSGLERSVFRAVNGLPGWLEWLLWAPMQLGTVVVVPVAALVAFLVWRCRRPALDIVAAGGAAWVAAKVMKDLRGEGPARRPVGSRPAPGIARCKQPDRVGTPVRTRNRRLRPGRCGPFVAHAAAQERGARPRRGRGAEPPLLRGAPPLDALGGAALGVAVGAGVTSWPISVRRGPAPRDDEVVREISACGPGRRTTKHAIGVTVARPLPVLPE